MKTEGRKPPTTGLLRREVIGPPDCPILIRWTVLGWNSWPFKLLVHRFLPNADDRDAHDHPRGCWTLVLRGGYDDDVPCPWCGDGKLRIRRWTAAEGDTDRCGRCDTPGGGGLVPGDRMRPGMIRWRPATYRHRTRVLPTGAWTIVLMGPFRRPWGFWRDGRWWPWRVYERHFGFGMRCSE